MEKKVFGNFDKNALEENYKKALEDADFARLVKTTGLDDKVLMKYTSKLEESVNELKNCSKCKGLPFCKNRVHGFVYYPRKVDNRLVFDSIACKFQQKVFKDEALSCKYYEMPEALLHASMRDIDISDSKRTAAIKALKGFYDDYPSNHNIKGIYLNGSFGSGKTFLVCAMLNELAKKGTDIIVVYYPELLRSLKESFNISTSDSDFATRMSRLKKASILFIDDIGAESVTPWARDEILGTILQYRMDASLPTFFTSNLTLEELEKHLSSTKDNIDKVKARRIVERIKQLTISIELVSKNRRN